MARKPREQRIAEKRGRVRNTPTGPRKEDVLPGKRFHLTEYGVRMLLSKDPAYRGPENRDERRRWDKWWRLKGRGYTKPRKRGERFK